ncbi:MAG TPA: alpha/beta fold hydrolase [Alphaproteobacteria bacterium]|nr:alpha/beta fold hydrolase [Alphaproteobacteria bacterium]
MRGLLFLYAMQLHFKQLGQGRPLVMLHGLFGSLDNWLGVAPKLAGTFSLFLVDLRNHGLSPHGEDMNYSVMAGDLAEFFDSQKLDRASLIGHSMGGKAAMQFALNFPGRVEKLVVVDISPRASPHNHEEIFRALMALDPMQYQSRGQMEEVLARDIPDLAVRRFLLKNLRSVRDTSPAASSHFEWRIPLDILFKGYPNICDAIPFREPSLEGGCAGDQPQRATTSASAAPKAFGGAALPPHRRAPNANRFIGPALFVRGGKSHYIAEDGLPQIQELFPQARIETIAAAGHWVHADAPEEFLQRVKAFLMD